MKLFVLLLAFGICKYAYSSDEDSSEWGIRGIKTVKTTNCSCGWALKPGKRIVNGREAHINEFPWMAGLMSQALKIVVCGGSIITRQHVLTAAHCTTPMKQANKAMAVVIGEHDLIRRTETDATEIINVERSIEHENYGLLAHPNDIALLVLERKIDFSDKVGPACLPNMLMDLTGQSIRVIGWGRTSETGSGSSVLMKVNLDVISTSDCNKKLSAIKIPENIPRQFCTYRENKDSCKGDSGGPLVWLDPETNRYTQVGLVSFGMGCAKTPGVNTNVAYYLDWINKNIKETRQDAVICSKL